MKEISHVSVWQNRKGWSEFIPFRKARSFQQDSMAIVNDVGVNCSSCHVDAGSVRSE